MTDHNARQAGLRDAIRIVTEMVDYWVLNQNVHIDHESVMDESLKCLRRFVYQPMDSSDESESGWAAVLTMDMRHDLCAISDAVCEGDARKAQALIREILAAHSADARNGEGVALTDEIAERVSKMRNALYAIAQSDPNGYAYELRVIAAKAWEESLTLAAPTAPAPKDECGMTTEDWKQVERDAAAPAPAAQAEPMARFCPQCGLVGEVGNQYRDCCPDGSSARIVPQKFAEQCRDLFRMAVDGITQQSANPAANAPPAGHFVRRSMHGPWVEVDPTKESGTPLYLGPADAASEADKRDAALEEAAQICESLAKHRGELGDSVSSEQAEECADTIRAAIQRERQQGGSDATA